MCRLSRTDQSCCRANTSSNSSYSMTRSRMCSLQNDISIECVLYRKSSSSI